MNNYDVPTLIALARREATGRRRAFGIHMGEIPIDVLLDRLADALERLETERAATAEPPSGRRWSRR